MAPKRKQKNLHPERYRTRVLPNAKLFRDGDLRQKGFTEREIRFIQNIVGGQPDKSVAAKEAGYSAKSARRKGTQLFHKPKIAAEIAKALTAEADKQGLNKEAWVRETDRRANYNLLDIAEWRNGQLVLKDPKEWPPDFPTAMIESVTSKNGVTTFKMHNSYPYFELKGKIMGIIPMSNRLMFSAGGGESSGTEVLIILPNNDRQPALSEGAPPPSPAQTIIDLPPTAAVEAPAPAPVAV